MGDYYWGDLYISLNFLNIYIISTIKWEAFMKKQKYKKYKQIDNLYVINNNLTKEEIIEIQSKSYYLALKQIEEEKQIEDKKNTSPNPNDNKIQYSKKIPQKHIKILNPSFDTTILVTGKKPHIIIITPNKIPILSILLIQAFW